MVDGEWDNSKADVLDAVVSAVRAVESRLARFCEARHGLKVGEDGGCFESALASVRRCGGVIEHPAFSKAWARFGLPRPETKREGWTEGECGGCSCYVEQGRYGHIMKKATWLYVFGVPRERLPALKWGHTPDNRGQLAKKQDWRGGMDAWRNATGHRVANATPPEFRDVLVALALSANDIAETRPETTGQTN